jgi:hypothetical protein
VITDTKAGDGETLPVLLGQAKANLPEGRIKTLAYDKAADSDEVHKLLSGEGIMPLIQMRGLWEINPERMLPGHDGSSNVVYKEDGTIYCYDNVSEPPVLHQMAYIGYEPERETLKYRCPAKHEDWDCPMSKICNAGKSYGKTVRVDRQLDPRRFPSLPRATKKFERMYKGRTSVERVNARLKVFWGVEMGPSTFPWCQNMGGPPEFPFGGNRPGAFAAEAGTGYDRECLATDETSRYGCLARWRAGS